MSALTIAMAIGLGGILAFLSGRAHSALTELGAHLQIEAFFVPEVSSLEAVSIMNNEFVKNHDLRSATIVTKEQAIEEYKKATGEDAEAVLGYNPLPASVRVELLEPTSVNAKRVASFLKSHPKVAEVHYDAEALTTLEDRARSLKMLSFLIGGILLLAALTFLHTTTRLAIQARRDTLKTMLLLGADRATLQLPFVLEGATIGLLGGLLGSGLFLLIGRLLLPEISPELGLHRLDLTASAPLLLAQLGIGLLLGSVMSYFSTLVWVLRGR